MGHNHPAQKMQPYNMLITREYVTLKITTSVYKLKSLFKNKGLFLKGISTATSNGKISTKRDVWSLGTKVCLLENDRNLSIFDIFIMITCSHKDYNPLNLALF